MLYLSIDQHRKQLTVNLRNESGDVILKRQVSTEWPRVRRFLKEMQEQSHSEGGFVTILEVCGFNDWLLKLLVEYGCRETILVQPEKQSKKKTDRRDANALGEILWVNRERLLADKKVQGIRRVQPACQQDAEDRQITALRKRLGQLRTRTINKIKHILRKHNLEQECPTKLIDTIKGKKWLGQLALGPIDRLEMDQLLTQWQLWNEPDREGGSRDPETASRESHGRRVGDDSGLRGVQQPRISLPDRLDRSVSAAGQPGELLGPNTGLPELRPGHRPTGFDHQARQRHGTLHPRTGGATRLAT